MTKQELLSVLDEFRAEMDRIREKVDRMDDAFDEHNAAAIEVLQKRADCCRDVIKERIETKRHFDVSFYAGEKQGYEQAIDLLKSPTESIRTEL